MSEVRPGDRVLVRAYALPVYPGREETIRENPDAYCPIPLRVLPQPNYVEEDSHLVCVGDMNIRGWDYESHYRLTEPATGQTQVWYVSKDECLLAFTQDLVIEGVCLCLDHDMSA